MKERSGCGGAVASIVMGCLIGLLAASVFLLVQADRLQARMKLEAVGQRLNAAVLSSDSATATLRAWCAEHGLAGDPTIRAERDATVVRPPSPETARRLAVGGPEQVRHRFVRLRCGPVLLSEADNWYVPERLTAEMNRVLETTDTPFGTVVAALRPTRRTEAVEQLWELLPPGWERWNRGRLLVWSVTQESAPGAEDPGQAMFRHVAVLRREADRLPISEVHETYQSGALAKVQR